MIEHIPLVFNLANASVGVAVDGGRGKNISLLIKFARPSVDDSSSIGERTERMVAVGISQCVIGYREPEVAVGCEPAVYKHIFILDFPDGRSLKKSENTWLLVAWNHVLHDFGPRLDSCHGGWVELSRV